MLLTLFYFKESPLPVPQTLQRELQGHKSKIEDVLEKAGIIASIRSPEADCVRAGQDQLAQLWGLLCVETERRQLVLDALYQAQQYFFDTAEVEAWLSEQELHMMNEENGKVCVKLSESYLRVQFKKTVCVYYCKSKTHLCLCLTPTRMSQARYSC